MSQKTPCYTYTSVASGSLCYYFVQKQQTELDFDLFFLSFCACAGRPRPPADVPVHAGVCSVVVEGSLRADAALLTLLPTVLRDGQGGAAALAGRHTGAVLHGFRTGERCRDGRRRRTLTSMFPQLSHESGSRLLRTLVYNTVSFG